MWLDKAKPLRELLQLVVATVVVVVLLFLFNIYYTLPRNGSFSTRGVAKGDNNYCGLLELPYGIRQSDNNNNKTQQQLTSIAASLSLSPSLTLLLSLGSHSIARETKWRRATKRKKKNLFKTLRQSDQFTIEKLVHYSPAHKETYSIYYTYVYFHNIFAIY